jgi:16S rRNA (uracil1498-N3)-methyltransferase
MTPRVFAPDLISPPFDTAPTPTPGPTHVRLSAEESAHLTRVLRLRPGARVLVFDGRGAQYLGELETATKQAVTIALLEPSPAAPEPRIRLTLAQAVLKGDKMDAIIRDATMMGVSAIVPLVTDRTVVPRAAAEQARVLERWHRVAVASAKQCGRAVVPTIETPRDMATLLTDSDPACLRLHLVEPSASASAQETEGEPAARDSDARSLEPGAWSLPAEPPERALLLIGPEGGWSPEEVTAAAAADCRPWTLGARTLRAESAPLAALAVLTYAWRL